MAFFKKLKNKIRTSLGNIRQNLDFPLRSELEEKAQVEKKKAEEKKAKKEWFEPEGKLAIDVYKTDGEIIIEAPVAGVKAEDLHISLKGDVVRIKGYRERPSEVLKKDYFLQECYWGKFSREIILPEETDPSRAEAFIREGILTIKTPKIHREKERVVKIKEEKE